jgi:hypothetical protein
MAECRLARRKPHTVQGATLGYHVALGIGRFLKGLLTKSTSGGILSDT